MRKSKSSEELDVVKKIAEAVQKKFGTASAVLLSESEDFVAENFIDTGHWGLNKIISGRGNGGVPVGRLTEFYGKPSTGKSLITATLLANCQKVGGIACLDDTERAYSKHFGEVLGVDNNALLYCASETVEEVFEKAEEIVKLIGDKLAVYVWDSVALTPTKAELEQSISDVSGYQTEKAKMIHLGIRKIAGLIAKSDIAFVVTNHMREKLGVVYGDKETTPGGEGISFFASVRVKLTVKETLTDSSKEIIGVRGVAYVKKNKIHIPFGTCTYDIYFDKGIKFASGCVDLLLKQGVVKEATTGWFEYKGKKYRRVDLENYFEENREELLQY